MNLFEPQHSLGREHWGIPATRWQRALRWRGLIQLLLPALMWAGAAGIVLAWLTTGSRTWWLSALAVGLLALACAVSGRAIYLACRPDILICEAGLLLGRTAKCRRELRWEESFTCHWHRRDARRLMVQAPQELLEYRIPTDSRKRLSAELRRRGKWTEATP